MKGHGSMAAYRRGCRCEDCRRANRDHMRNYRNTGSATGEYAPGAWEPVNGQLQVECWCQRKIVTVPVEEVQQLRTRSCDAPDCTPAQVRPA